MGTAWGSAALITGGKAGLLGITSMASIIIASAGQLFTSLISSLLSMVYVFKTRDALTADNVAQKPEIITCPSGLFCRKKPEKSTKIYPSKHGYKKISTSENKVDQSDQIISSITY